MDLRAPSADRRETLHSDQHICQLFNASPKIRGPPLKFLPPLNFRSISHNFRLSSRISPERDKTSKTGKTCDPERFLPRSGKQVGWTLVHYPQSSTCEFRPTQVDFFRQTIFRPLEGVGHWYFLHTLEFDQTLVAHTAFGRGSPWKILRVTI